MPLDSLFDYLRRCKGQDFLTFSDADAASKARTLLIDQLDDDGVAVEKRPSIDQFDNQLRLRLKELRHEPESTEQAAEIF